MKMRGFNMFKSRPLEKAIMCVHCGEPLIEKPDLALSKDVHKVRFYAPVETGGMYRRSSCTFTDDNVSDFILCKTCFIHLRRAFPECLDKDNTNLLHIGLTNFTDMNTYMAFQVLFNRNYDYITRGVFDQVLQMIDLDDCKNLLRMLMTEDWNITYIGKTLCRYQDVNWTELSQVVFRMEGKPFYQDDYPVHYALVEYKSHFGNDSIHLVVTTDIGQLEREIQGFVYSGSFSDRHKLLERGTFKMTASEIRSMQKHIIDIYKTCKVTTGTNRNMLYVEMNIQLGGRTFYPDYAKFLYPSEST
jgi:hypothetical protein